MSVLRQSTTSNIAETKFKDMYSLSTDVPKLHAPLTTRHKNLVHICRRMMEHYGSESRLELDGRLQFWSKVNERTSYKGDLPTHLHSQYPRQEVYYHPQ